MSRAARRARTSARSRRTPVRPAGRTGFSVPWVPVVVVVAVALVVGLVVFLIIQSRGEGGLPNSEAQAIEADPAPDLPGEFVDLPTIYAGCYHCEEGADTGDHLRQSVDYTDQGLPPAGGPHWGSGPCADTLAESGPFCGPVKWGIYRAPDLWDAPSLVHNMEHAGVIVWYNTADQDVISQLEEVVKDRLDADKLVVLVPYDDIAEDTIAMTAWARRETFPVTEYSDERVDDFINAFSRRFNPEGI